MARLLKTGIFGLIMAVSAGVFIFSSESKTRTAMSDLPERPPTFDELFELAENNQASISLIESFFNNQSSTDGAEKFLALADDGNMTARVSSSHGTTGPQVA